MQAGLQQNSQEAHWRCRFLECDDVRDYARVRLNGIDLPARAWQPYRWDVTAAAKSGKNLLEIEVRGLPAGRGPVTPTVSGLLPPLRLVWRVDL